MTALDLVKSEIRKMTVNDIKLCVVQMGGGHLANEEARLVRAAMIDVYSEKTSPEDAEKLMDFVGL
jgi:hypothetical protein